MNKYFILALAVVIIVAGTIFFWPNDEKEIRANLDSLAEYCTSAAKEPVFETLKKAALAAKLCTNPCKVQIESFKIDKKFSQKEITDQILMVKKRLLNTRFSFHDTVVKIPENNRAKILTTLLLNGKTVDERFTDAYELNIAVEKQDGDWRFSSFTIVEFVKK